MIASRQKLTLHSPRIYEIRVPGELDKSWAEWDGTMTVTVERKGDGPPITVLTGVVDQAALHSLLRRLYGLGLPLISVICLACGADD